MNTSKIATLIFTASLLVCGASVAAAADREVTLGEKFLDGMIVRPIGVALSLATTALYLGTSPLTFLMDLDEPAADVLVSRPWEATSGRPLGDFGG